MDEKEKDIWIFELYEYRYGNPLLVHQIQKRNRKTWKLDTLCLQIIREMGRDESKGGHCLKGTIAIFNEESQAILVVSFNSELKQKS